MAPQMTGCAITYCRKYALCGLLSVGSGDKDPDSMDNRPEGTIQPQQRKQWTKPKDEMEKRRYSDKPQEDNPGYQALQQFCRGMVDSGLGTKEKARRFFNYYKDKVTCRSIDLNEKWGKWRDEYEPKTK